MSDTFVPPEFILPAPPAGDGFHLTPLLVEHTEADLDAWSTSVEHIHATPGFEGHPWPDEPMTVERNREDLQGHVDDWEARRGFTYSVVSDPDGEVVGCVYVYPSRTDGTEAHVRSWVRASRPELDVPVDRLVSTWLAESWPFRAVEYAARG